MGSKLTGGILLLAGLLFSAVTTAMQTQNDDVGALINKRLSYMKDVAGYKARNHLAIDDLRQEDRVLFDSMLEAEKLGLNSESVTPFIRAQMDVAKAIQYRYRADWLSVPETDWKPEPLEKVRNAISVLNSRILAAISTGLATDEAFADKDKFIQQLNQTHLKDSDKELLWRSLGKVKLKNDK
ncbi:chorismate mutase [Enterobacter sp. KBR-315C3_2022]|uniref:chorismate mutase n=1 Tax=Enterobacter sp. KBR-315C3_2022 TaxID=3242494 RepID=UPI003527A73B